MPTCLSPIRILNRKKAKLAFLFIFSPLFFFGQTLTGLWTGSLRNDSSTVRKDQSFEIALTEYRGKVYGYSRSEFIVDDTLYYVVKRVKGTIEGDICEVTDDEIIAYNFRGKLDKGIKVTSTFRRDKSDSSWYLAGTWKTNATKKYYSVTGKVSLAEEKDLSASKIFPHLEELNLAGEIASYQEKKEAVSIVRMVKPEKIKTEYSTKPIIETTVPDIAIAKPVLQRAEARPVPEQSITASALPANEIAKNNIPNTIEPEEEFKKDKVTIVAADKKQPASIPVSAVAVNIAQPNTQRAVYNTPVSAIENEKGNAIEQPFNKNQPTETASRTNTTASANTELNKERKNPVVATDKKSPAMNTVAANNDKNKTESKPKDPAVANTSVAKVNASSNQTQTGKPVDNNIVAKNSSAPPQHVKTEPAPVKPMVAVPEIKKPAVDVIALSSKVGGRRSEFSQVVSFKADSLELSLYDNGEIDGDTVSIFLNGEVVMSKQVLKASAIKKTIYITPGNEEFTLVLFAENLGKYPPNTGLLVVHDGDDVYNLRFSSDYQKNAGIIFRRNR